MLTDDTYKSTWRLAGVTDHGRRIATENVAAARNDDLDPCDPRWVLAARVQSQLEGATLPPEGRRLVMKLADQLGLRPFDANVIIALVQDRARRGETVQDTVDSLRMVNPPQRGATRSSDLVRWITALAAGIIATWMLVRWVTG